MNFFVPESCVSITQRLLDISLWKVEGLSGTRNKKQIYSLYNQQLQQRDDGQASASNLVIAENPSEMSTAPFEKLWNESDEE